MFLHFFRSASDTLQLHHLLYKHERDPCVDIQKDTETLTVHNTFL